jgi:hypothetical protein
MNPFASKNEEPYKRPPQQLPASFQFTGKGFVSRLLTSNSNIKSISIDFQSSITDAPFLKIANTQIVLAIEEGQFILYGLRTRLKLFSDNVSNNVLRRIKLEFNASNITATLDDKNSVSNAFMSISWKKGLLILLGGGNGQFMQDDPLFVGCMKNIQIDGVVQKFENFRFHRHELPACV